MPFGKHALFVLKTVWANREHTESMNSACVLEENYRSMLNERKEILISR